MAVRRLKAQVAEMLAERKIPFTGCPAPALALALDKAHTKDTFRSIRNSHPQISDFNPG